MFNFPHKYTLQTPFIVPYYYYDCINGQLSMYKWTVKGLSCCNITKSV